MSGLHLALAAGWKEGPEAQGRGWQLPLSVSLKLIFCAQRSRMVLKETLSSQSGDGTSSDRDRALALQDEGSRSLSKMSKTGKHPGPGTRASEKASNKQPMNRNASSLAVGLNRDDPLSSGLGS